MTQHPPESGLVAGEDGSRRDFLRTSVLAAGVVALGGAEAGAPWSQPVRAGVARATRDQTPRALDILILGGTTFLGPHQIRYALERGHSVTTFTRGRTEPTLHREVFQHVEALTGDRDTGDLDALRGRTWDVVIDNSGRDEAWTRESADLLRDSVARYMYTSSTGVYLPYLGTHIDEDTDVLLEDPPDVPESQRPSYGVMKARSEVEAKRVFGEARTIIVRPTYIVGPGDPTNRFIYWPVRVERGGEVLVPGKAEDPVQYIDARDLTEWMIRLAEAGAGGTYNATGPASPLGMHAFVHGVHAATSAPVHWVYADDYTFLTDHGVRFAIPWLMPVDDYVGSARIANARAVAAGLDFRPLATTVADTLAWWRSDAVDAERREDFIDDPRGMIAREAEIIAAWKART